jgi:hypothetical protein
MTERAKPPVRHFKPPTPRFHYSLATVTGSRQARLMEDALREPLRGLGLSFFAIGHEDGSYDVIGDHGSSALTDEVLRGVRAVADKIKMAG